MNKIERAIALRDVSEKGQELFQEVIQETKEQGLVLAELEQIKNGYDNIQSVASILYIRTKFL